MNNQGFGQNNNFGGSAQQGNAMDMFIEDSVQASAGFGDLPKGIYACQITAAEYKQNTKQNGMLLSLELTVMLGDYTGRKIFDNYNLQHENATAQNIGQANYAKLNDSCFGKGTPRKRNPQELIGANVCIDYGPQRQKKNSNQDMYGAPQNDEPQEPQMEVKDRLPASAYKAPASYGQQQPQQQVQQPAKQFSHPQNHQTAFNNQQTQQPQGQFQGSGDAGNQQQQTHQQGGAVQNDAGTGAFGNNQGNGATPENNGQFNPAGNVSQQQQQQVQQQPQGQQPQNNGGGSPFGSGGFGNM